MNCSTMKRVICIVQFVGLCLATTVANPPTHASCPCRSFNECPKSFHINTEDARAAELSCGNKNFIRCCTAVEDGILTSQHTVDSSTRIDDMAEKIWPKEQMDGYKKLIEFMQKRVSALTNGNQRRAQQQVKSTGSAEPELLMNAISPSPPVNCSNTKIQIFGEESNNVRGKITEHVKHVTALTNDREALAASLSQNKRTGELKEASLKSMHVKVLDHMPTRIQAYSIEPRHFAVQNTAAGTEKVNVFVEKEYSRLPSKVDEQLDFQEIAGKVFDFESFRVPSKKEPSRYQLPLEKYVKGSSGAGGTLEILARSKDVPGKMSNFSEQKTPLSTFTTVDQISTQVVNENIPKPAVKIDISEDDVVLENALLLGNIQDIKRIVRSNNEQMETLKSETKSDITEDDKNSTSVTLTNSESIDANDKATNRTSSRRFKRPPRILSTRITQIRQQKTQPNLQITQDYKQRTLDLFNRSNEKRRNRASLIINRDNVKIHKVPFVNNSSPVAVRPRNLTSSTTKDQIDSSETITKGSQINLSEITTENTLTTVTASEETEPGDLARNR